MCQATFSKTNLTEVYVADISVSKMYRKLVQILVD